MSNVRKNKNPQFNTELPFQKVLQYFGFAMVAGELNQKIVLHFYCYFWSLLCWQAKT